MTSRPEDLRRTLIGEKDRSPDLTIVQWNVLADWAAFGSFDRAPTDSLPWDVRGPRVLTLLEDGLPQPPDVICLQEVDQHDDLAEALCARGYAAEFVPKEEGRDGCSMFVRAATHALVATQTVRYREPDGTPHSQLALIAQLRNLADGGIIQVATTHLKAKPGHEELRLRQVEQLIAGLDASLPTIVTGDFNDVPGSLAHAHVATHLRSAYADVLGAEPAWTTWKVRGDEETRRTIDYVWYSEPHFRALSCLDLPAEDRVQPERFPSWQYPSDHLSLAVQFARR